MQIKRQKAYLNAAHTLTDPTFKGSLLLCSVSLASLTNGKIASGE